MLEQDPFDAAVIHLLQNASSPSLKKAGSVIFQHFLKIEAAVEGLGGENLYTPEVLQFYPLSIS